jgi:hypothetical protein
MTPDEEHCFGQHVYNILREHPEGMTEAAIVAEMKRRGFITPKMYEEFVKEGFLTNIYYILERKVLWTEVSPRQIRRQRRQSTQPPIVRTGVLCDREGRTLCTVSQDAAGEYHLPRNVEDYMREVLEAYPDWPEDYVRPPHPVR